MSDLSQFRVYADEPSIIYQISSADCPPGITWEDMGEACELWLTQEYPGCSFVYETESFTVFLDGGHGLVEGQIRLVQQKARAYVRGLTHGVEMDRRITQTRGNLS